MHRTCRTWFCTTLLTIAAVQPAFAQFNITTAVGAQTLTTGTGTVTSSGNVSTGGSTVGVTISGTSTLINSGTIQQTGTGRAIDNTANNSNLTVTNTGTISAVSTDAFRINSANTSVVLTNSGTIQVSNGGQAIDWAAITTASNTLTNQFGGIISAFNEDAVRPGQNGIINNAGTISATPTVTAGVVSGSDGIDLRTQKTVTVTNTGTITGRHGIATDGANVGPSSLTVNNSAGTIQAVNGSGINVDGVNTSVTANVTNAFGATIKGGVLASAIDGDGDGIDVDGVLTLNNSGDVLGLGARGGDGTGNNAEAVAAGGGSITNTATGRIIGSTLLADAPNGDSARAGNGILIDDSNGGNAVAATTVSNSGLIQGKSGFGIKMVGTFGDTVSNLAGGVIRGAGSGAVLDTGGGNDTVSNAGSIIHEGGGSQTAVDLGAGNDTLNYNGGTITGAINGGVGANTLNLGAGVSHSYATQNFQNINVATGSSSLSGIVSGINLTKGGNGTLVLSGANDYTGTTTVATGKLLVNNFTGSGTGSSAVFVDSGATLGGAGFVAGTITVDGIIAPGNSIGTFTVGNSVTWNGSAGNKWNFELGGGTASDLLNITGNFLKGTGDNFYFDFLNSTNPGTYVLVNWSNATNFLASDFSYVNLGADLTGTFVINDSHLEFTVIPEPATTSLFTGFGVLAAVVHFRRRRTVVV